MRRSRREPSIECILACKVAGAKCEFPTYTLSLILREFLIGWSLTPATAVSLRFPTLPGLSRTIVDYVIYIRELEHQAPGSRFRLKEFGGYCPAKREAKAAVFSLQAMMCLVEMVTVPGKSSDGNEAVSTCGFKSDEEAKSCDATDPA